MMIYERSEWGARSPKRAYQPLRPAGIVVHHTAGPNGEYSLDWEKLYQRAMQRYHMDRNNWTDIAQHYTVFQSGRIFRGVPEQYRGTHAAGVNVTHLGIECQGTFIDVDPPPKLFDSLVRLCTDLCRRYGLSPSAIIGHRQVSATQCPGEKLYVRLPELRRRVAILLIRHSATLKTGGSMDSKIYEGAEGRIPCYVGRIGGHPTKPFMWAYLNACSGPLPTEQTVTVWWEDGDGTRRSSVQALKVPPRGKRGIDLYWLAGSQNFDGFVCWQTSAPVVVQIDRTLT